MREREPVHLNLAGLRIRRIEGDGPEPGEQDLVWRHRRVASLPGGAAGDGPLVTVHAEESGDGPLTDFRFGYGGRVRCRFIVGAGGRWVESWAVPAVTDRDLVALFGEHILRTVLVRRGLISFHAASLTDGDGSILIMGDKGMGKSTLSSALQQRGWSPVADDLTRVAETGGTWRAFAGLRDTKLLADSAAALGLQREGLPPRWDDRDGAADDKRLLSPLFEPPSDERAFRLRALLVLKPRGTGGGELFHRSASPILAVRAMLEHSTGDPLHPGAPPPPAVQRAIGALVKSLPVIETALPDRLDALRPSAEAIEALVRGVDARRAA
jgi:hypothetical protein